MEPVVSSGGIQIGGTSGSVSASVNVGGGGLVVGGSAVVEG
jgi:hypothetical protein